MSADINMVDAIRQLEEQKRACERKYEADIAAFEIALCKLREINTVCEKCGGAKGSEYRVCAEADIEWHRCNACGGTGRSRP